MTFTATFDKPVIGVVSADFNLVSSTPGITTTRSVSTTDNLKWVLAVEVTNGFATTALSVTMPADSGIIRDKNAAAVNQGFFLTCTLWVQGS